MSEDEPFLRRWARRKQDATLDEVRKPGVDAPCAPAPIEAPESPQDLVPEPQTFAPPATAPEDDTTADSGPPPFSEETEAGGDDADPEASLPPIESLDYESDYSGFMADGVSETLRRQALRRLWRSNPILANVDGLNDYDDDFTDAALVKDNLKTAFDAIKGYARDDDLTDQDDADANADAGDSPASPSDGDEAPKELGQEDDTEDLTAADQAPSHETDPNNEDVTEGSGAQDKDVIANAKANDDAQARQVESGDSPVAPAEDPSFISGNEKH